MNTRGTSLPTTTGAFMTTAILGSLLYAGEPAETGAETAPFVPTSAYVEKQIEGWTVLVNRDLLEGKSRETGAQALRLLENKLYEITRAVPPAACGRLRDVRIWLGVDDGHAPCAEYHPSEAWLRKNGYNPDKARCVEIGNASRFLAWSHTQPAMVLHELAHAYMDRDMPADRLGPVREAYQEAKRKGLYAEALHPDGNRREAYAMSNVKEYFAELSEALFGTNDIYPFVRPELLAHDPKGAAAVREAWENAPATSR